MLKVKVYVSISIGQSEKLRDLSFSESQCVRGRQIHMTASLRSQHLCFVEGQNGKNEKMKMQKQVNKSD